MKICKFCGAENLDEASFCAFCGSGFDSESGAEKPSETAADNIEMAVHTNEVSAEPSETLSEQRAEGAIPQADTAVPADENAFYETVVPSRVKDNIKSLAVYLWFCAALNLFIAIVAGDILSLTIAAADALLAVFIRKRKLWASIAGIVYSAAGGVIFTLWSVLSGDGIGSTRLLLGWACSLFLFISALQSLRTIRKAWITYKDTGKDPWDNPADREAEERFKKQSRKNRIIGYSVLGVLVAILIAVSAVSAVRDNARYKGLDGGYWEGRVYTNAFFGFTYTLPDTWTRTSDGEIDESNEYYYGGTDVKKCGGTLLEAYDMPTADESWVAVYVSVIRHNGDGYTAEEVLSSWRAENESYAAEYAEEYTALEMDPMHMMGREFAAVKETYLYPLEEGSDELFSETSYTYVTQEGRYTLSVTVYVYDPAMTDADVAGILEDAFAAAMQ